MNPINVLVVQDFKQYRENMFGALDSIEGVNAIVPSTPEEALLLLGDMQIDLLLLDGDLGDFKHLSNIVNSSLFLRECRTRGINMPLIASISRDKGNEELIKSLGFNVIESNIDPAKKLDYIAIEVMIVFQKAGIVPKK